MGIISGSGSFRGLYRSSRSPAARSVRARDLWLRQSFERPDPITLPFISPESRLDPGNLIGQLIKRFLKELLLVKFVMILPKPVLPRESCQVS